MDTFILVAVFIIALWLVAIGYYFYTVRQQADLAGTIEELQEILEEEEDETAYEEEE